jgi:translation initiation factor IF-2
MAEETENTQKPKAELIKHTQADNSSTKGPAGGGQPESSERRKVIVVKKKPATPSGGADQGAQPPPAVGARKKVIVASHPKDETDAAEKPAAAKDLHHPSETSSQADGTQVKPHDAASSTGGSSPSSTPFPFSQRPAVAVGRVGGKQVGRKFHDDNRGGSSVGKGAGQPRHPSPPPRQPQGGFRQNPGAPQHSTPRPGGPQGRQGFTPRPPQGRGGQSSGSPPPSILPEGKSGAKRTFRAKKPTYNRKEKELEMEEKLRQTRKKITYVANPVPKSIEIMENISVSELARKMNLKASDLIQKLMKLGMMATINQQIDADTATILAAEFGADVKIISLYDETIIDTGTDEGADMLPRPPVVTVMGHVDHGKTKLLDAIRKADVVSGEFGGITQHIGAYMVETPHGRITFLDTPGHEAFTRMRARGAQVTDIVVLVVAADDGVMPQTIEAINHAKEAGVPIIVAVNKIDKPEANPDRVKSQLSEIGLMPEEWGGQTMFVELSALQKTGIDKLIDTILLEAELLDLKANFHRSAEGKILESRIDHGRGIVATVIVERGTISVGDSFVAGIWPGKVRAIFNDRGEKLKHASPSMPVEILGFEGIPNAGDPLQAVEDEKIAREFSSKRQELKRFEDAKNFKQVTAETLRDRISDGTIQELKVIIKADVQGSAEALESSLEKLSTKEIRLHVIQALPGPINEGDVDLAIASKAIIIGFNVRPLPKAKVLAEQEKVDIRKYNIIYKAVEEIHQAMEGMLKPEDFNGHRGRSVL